MVSEPSGVKNLKLEGIADNKVRLVGNIMIECLLRTRKHWETIQLNTEIQPFYDSKPVVATFHRPENVDNPESLKLILGILQNFSGDHRVVFPVHPRTRMRLEQNKWLDKIQSDPNILVTEPLSYFEFLKLVSNASLVITDSGGVQEETSFLNIPCVTFRKNTERPVTVELGTNLMMDIRDSDFRSQIDAHISGLNKRKISAIPLWDDQVSDRIVTHIKKILGI
jgi:UDP-N-acetylglucosamine 2-epimerase (non-hydrolysing)